MEVSKPTHHQGAPRRLPLHLNPVLTPGSLLFQPHHGWKPSVRRDTDAPCIQDGFGLSSSLRPCFYTPDRPRTTKETVKFGNHGSM